MNNIIEYIYYSLDEKSHYGLKIIFNLKGGNYLYFDSSNFILKNKEAIEITPEWIKIEYKELENSISIDEIKEDETVAFFVKFSNNDIFYIYQYIDGIEDWFLDFEILSPNNPKYNEIFEHMNEDWIEKIDF